MVRLSVVALVALAATIVPANAFATEMTKLVPVSEATFAKVLAGCWGAEWYAELVDGGELSGLDKVCFEPDGRVLTESMPYPHADGIYQLSDRKLRLQSASSEGKWLFDAAALSCDATVSEGGSLTLSKCVEDGTGRELYDSHFSALDEDAQNDASAEEVYP